MKHSPADMAWARPAEREFLKRVKDLSEQVRTSSRWYLTDFLTVREQILLEGAVSQFDIILALQGGQSGAERKRVLLMPEDWYPQLDDFDLAVLKLDVTADELTHGAILGSILGCGLERRKVGDIQCVGRTGYVVVCKDITNYLYTTLQAIGRHPVSLEWVTPTSVPWCEPAYIRDLVYVASLRVDALVASGCRWSRQVAQVAISKGNVQINSLQVKDTDETILEGDLISIRGFGRIQVFEVGGESKSGRFRVEVGVLRSNQRGI